MRLFYLLSVLTIVSASQAADDSILYNRDIRPILAETCFTCHGPDSASRKADLRLDRREAAIEGGAIVPGKPDESELISRIFSDDADESCRRRVAQEAHRRAEGPAAAAGSPPAPSTSRTGPSSRRCGRRRRPSRMRPGSAIRSTPSSWRSSKQHGLQPAPEADRRTLARRVSLDLTGLPPAPAEVEAFVNDPAPDAYEKFVDRLLASQHWGEHRGRYWLDAARYADTHGIHFDNYREMWAYRDWVIDAFNRNLPFDQFTIEQLAGDLLPDATLEQRIATGFNRCNITTNEGGVDRRGIPRALRPRPDRDDLPGSGSGLTAAAPSATTTSSIRSAQNEFYQMSAFFNNTTQAAMDGNIKDTPPVLASRAGGPGTAGKRLQRKTPRRRTRWTSAATRLALTSTLAGGGQTRRIGRRRSGERLVVPGPFERRTGRCTSP